MPEAIRQMFLINPARLLWCLASWCNHWALAVRLTYQVKGVPKR
jgi:hypothetical protein